MKFLLPHQFKKAGLVMASLGFALWLCMQFKITNRFFAFINLKEITTVTDGIGHSSYALTNTIVAIISFFSFLAGMYFLSFSKEKVEDEMISKIRLSSFQFAAFCQLFFIFCFAYMAISKKEPEGDGGFLLFFFAPFSCFGFYLSCVLITLFICNINYPVAIGLD
jgi:hypothetical protein